MTKFSDLKIGTRLAAGFGAILVLLVAIVAGSVVALAQTQARLDRIVNVDDAEMRSIVGMQLAVGEAAIAMRNLLLDSVPVHLQKQKQKPQC